MVATASKRENSEAQAIIEAVTKLTPVEERRLVTFEGISVPYHVGRNVDGEIAVQSLAHLVDPYRECPRRRQGQSTVDSTLSLVQFINRYKGENTTLWASLGDTSAMLSVVINDHQPGYGGSPEFANFGATYTPSFSKEWLDWMGAANKPMSQGDFGEFIEERLSDLSSQTSDPRALEVFAHLEVEPATPAALLQVSRGMRVSTTSKAVNAKNLSTGETEVVFKEEHDHSDAQGNKMRVPNAFVLSIPVFDNAPRVDIAGFLRYSIKSGEVKWLYRLFRPHLVRQEQFMALVTEVGNDTGVPVFQGKH